MRTSPAVEPLFTRRFVSLWVFQFGTFFSAFQLLPVIPLRIVELGGSKASAGLFLTAYTMSSAFAAPIMGTIADHIGRRRMLVAASLLFVVFSLLYGVVTWLPLLLVIGVAHGSLWSGLLAASGAIMTDLVPVTRRTEGFAWAGIAPTGSIAIAPAVGLAVYHFGWWALCVEIATLSAVAALWASRLEAGAARTPDSPFPRLRDLYDWGVVRAALSLAVTAFGYGGITSYVAILARERGIRPESIFFTVFAVTVVVIRVLTSRVGDRMGPRVLLFPALAAMPVAFVILAAATLRWQMVTAAIFFGFGMGLAFPAFMTIVMGSTSENSRARTYGSVIWAFDAGIGLGSIVIGAIGQRAGLGTAFNIAAGLSCLAIPIFLATAPRLSRGIAVADTASSWQNQPKSPK